MSDRHPVLFLTDRGQRHQQAALEAAPQELDVTMMRRPPKEEILRVLPEVEFLISERSGTVDADLIAAGRRLRLIQRLGSLTYDIDLEAARAAGVPVAAWPVRIAIMVAEHMILQILVLSKRLGEVAGIANEAGDWGKPSRRTDEDTFAYDWSGRNGIRSLYGLTVGILGFGEIGAELARRLQGFGPARILYRKRTRLPERAEQALGITYASMEKVIAESDTLCLLLPYFPETDMLLDAALLSRMKRGAFLVSCGSGSVINEAALAQALQEQHLAGVALDTFEWEPIRPDNPLLPLARDPTRNVLLTPHTAAGSSRDADSGQTRRSDYANLLRVLRGEPPLHRVA
ncbi:MAG TPA: NAD(P)-dependent oxidoreductase [Anaerolineae bacterium]|nr:NAD(P)-dependent oxidoreductase [Anaerolineae bacterium]